MQNSHSDVQQSSYRCINHGTHITGQSSKRFQGAASEFGHWGILSLLPPGSCQQGWTHGRGEQLQGQGLEGTQPLRVPTLPGQGWRAQLPQGQRPSHPSLTASRNFLDCKKKKNKAQAKSVINIRANSEEFGQPHGSAAPPRTSTASLEGTGSSGGGTAPPPTPELLPAQSRGTRGSAFLPLFLGSSKFFPNHLPTHKTFCAPLICVISLS